jgi:small subunit ribosomal protein S20
MTHIQFVLEDPLANLKSAIKRIRSNERKRVQNRIIRSRARSAVGTARDAIPTPKGEEAVQLALRELDRAAEKGVIHKNNAARRKSRLLRQLHASKKPKRDQ